MQPINPIIARVIQSNIEHGYQRFIKLVSESRNMTLEQVDKIAQGRVWAGENALEIGLVDKLGNLDQAIKRAAELAELEDYKTTYPTKSSDWKDQILNQFFSNLSLTLSSRIDNKPLIKRSLEFTNRFEGLNDPRGIYVKCLDCLIF